MSGDPVSPIGAVLQFVWDNFVQPNLARGATWSWKAAQWKRAANRYGQKLEQDYGKLFVLGQPEPKPIDDIYTYVNVLEKVRAFEIYAPDELQNLFMTRGLMHQTEERQNGLNQVKTGENLFILGKPGAGKTTFMKQVTMSAARGKLTRVVDNRLRSFLPEKYHQLETLTQLPIFISLRTHTESGRSLFESIEHELKICEFPEAGLFVDYLLHSGRAIVLWDGLDEVKRDEGVRQKLIDGMHDFMRQYRETQFLITCRVAATNYEFDNVRYLEMADFDDSQKRTFLHRWFAGNDDAVRCWNELQKEGNKGLQELARVPLLLTLLAITFDRTLTFPQRRVEIYEEAIDALLNSWDSKRRITRGEEPYKELSLGRKRQMLAHIAAKGFDEGEFLFPKRKLAEMIEAFMKRVPGLAEADIDGEIILKSIAARHGIFVEQAKDVFSFAHLSFQEYFAAKYIKDNARQRTLERLLVHAGEDQWREVFLLTVSLLDDDVDEFFALFVIQLQVMSQAGILTQQLLNWAAAKIDLTKNTVEQSYRTVSLRCWYLSIAFDLSKDIDLGLDSSLAGDFGHFRANTLALGGTLDLSLAITGYLYLACELLDLSFDLDLANDLHDAARISARVLLILARDLSADLEYADLHEALATSLMSDLDESEENWQAFAQSISVIIEQYRDILGLANFRQYSDEDRDTIARMAWSGKEFELYSVYLKATQLLVDCLPLAMVSNREAIEDQLFLPLEANPNETLENE